ncbi:HSP20 family protein [Bacillus mesophilus]|uniref:Hsp20/alpha crystallin family protein n=1 Tax=Bacillus mesophilus TaxID=1808955 RepID=A0A6M0QFI6_9BACI|nr:Hsp20/alpha crystallin family protein [Bacillus mesophilus]MBM7663472.1 HSP20 family protein [Bacillus mesophilus]NEY74178.1 Hsp20/alpha crystallin family protein [Bacillus mesophilus]
MNYNKNPHGKSPNAPNTLKNKKTENRKNEIRSPKVDLFETNQQYFLRLSLPGVRKENLKIFLNEQGILEISGRVVTHLPETTKNIIVQEIFQGPFQRKVKIPDLVDKQSIKFHYDNGILEVYMAKL